MKEITVLSGKGGTGKSSITAALASVVNNAVFCDNDVDASNLHIVFEPQIVQSDIYYGAWLASIDNSICNRCGICVLHCQFDAIHNKVGGEFYINEFECEGCRLCERVCPVNAITSKQSDKNRWYVGNSRFGTIVYAHLKPGEENSGKLISVIRKKAKELAVINNKQWIINDGPPGVGCSAISSLTGADGVIVVVEPSQSSLHDAERLMQLVDNFEIPAFVIINKYDLEENISKEIESFFADKNIPIIAKIPFSQLINEAMMMRKNVVEYATDSEIAKLIKKGWQIIENS